MEQNHRRRTLLQQRFKLSTAAVQSESKLPSWLAAALLQKLQLRMKRLEMFQLQQAQQTASLTHCR